VTWLALTLTALSLACSTEELGNPCGTVATDVPDPVQGEVPVVEVVRHERDSACESFQCLTHRGLPPYCTRTCELDSPAKAKACATDSECVGKPFAADLPGVCVNNVCQCTADAQCRAPNHCEAGQCVDDDCPDGYWCRQIQAVGPLSPSHYCVFKTGCKSNIDCEDLGAMTCDKLGCYDVCLRDYSTCEKPNKDRCDELACYDDCVRIGSSTYLCRDQSSDCQEAGCFDACTLPPGTACLFHRLVCEPFDTLGCQPTAGAPAECQSDIMQCEDRNMECRPDATEASWAAGTVRRQNTCTPKE